MTLKKKQPWSKAVLIFFVTLIVQLICQFVTEFKLDISLWRVLVFGLLGSLFKALYVVTAHSTILVVENNVLKLQFYCSITLCILFFVILLLLPLPLQLLQYSLPEIRKQVLPGPGSSKQFLVLVLATARSIIGNYSFLRNSVTSPLHAIICSIAFNSFLTTITTLPSNSTSRWMCSFTSTVGFIVCVYYYLQERSQKKPMLGTVQSV